MGFLAGMLDPALATAGAQPLAGLAVYPNPARTSATVRLPAAAGAPAATLILLDALGHPVRRQQLLAGRQQASRSLVE